MIICLALNYGFYKKIIKDNFKNHHEMIAEGNL